MRRSALIAIALIGTLAACQEDGPDVSELAAGGEFGVAVLAEAKSDCESGGGRWGATARGGSFICYRPTRDSGRQCRSGSDCEGLCLARSRTCAPVTPFLGCHETLTDSGLPATVCVE